MKLSNNTILITGGGSGIGLALAEKFLSLDNQVIICGRRPEVLAAAKSKNPGLHTYVCDLEQASSRERLFQKVSGNHPRLNVLVNNAGIQQWMQICDADFFDRALQEIAINVQAPVHLAALFANMPGIRTLINVSSGLSFVPLTKTPVYSATKAFIHSFTLSLRHMLKQLGIEVIELIPPALNTDLGGVGLHDQAPPVSEFIQAVFAQLEEGKTEITFGFSDNMVNAGPDDLKQTFARMNG